MTPYDEGVAAADCGFYLIHNPYPSGSNDFRLWESGFFDSIMAETNDCVMSA